MTDAQKTVLVTGANKGIGFEVCRELGQKGFRVMMGCRDEEKGKKACAILTGEGHKTELVLIDTSSESSIASAAQAVQKKTGHLDALVNNAGIFLESNSEGLQFSREIILRTFETNTLGPLLAARAFLPLLEQAEGSHIVNVSSGMGQLSDMREGSIGYRISKTALNAVTCILAAELSDRHIYVNSVCPGWVRTDMGGAEAQRTPAQGADTIVWLASGEAGAVTAGFYRDRQMIPW
jgi:NAD(P)-dependent dehydrogenase (short-subunit alcohol dehydrogenase family)